MNITTTVTYDRTSKTYRINNGSWKSSWDEVNNTNTSEFGFNVVDNQMLIQSFYQFSSIIIDTYPFNYEIRISNNTAIFIDNESADFHNINEFNFQITYVLADEDFECENIYGDTINVFEFGQDGVVYGTNSGDNTITPQSINADCCSALGYEFNSNDAKCYWAQPCVIDDYIKVIINPEGNDGVLFDIDENENCVLDISFDWLLEYDCQTLLTCADGGSIFNILSGVTLSMTLERMIESTNISAIPPHQIQTIPYVPETVYQSILFQGNNILDYFTMENSGIILIGDNCDVVTNSVEFELSTIFSGFTEQNLYSNWKHFEVSIVDPTVLTLIKNEKIKIALEVQNSSCDISILIDNIKLNKKCEIIDLEETFIATCPSFEMDRVVDNKKSWVANSSFEEREFDLKKRETDYYIKHHKLGINSKEVDLNVSPSRAIETDVMNTVLQNTCLLSTKIINNIIIDLQDNIINYGQGFVTNEGNNFINNLFGFSIEDDNLTIYSKSPMLGGEITSPSGNWNIQDFPNQYEIVFEFDYLAGETWHLIIENVGTENNLNGLITSTLNSEVFTLEEFTNIITSELIDVKDRQTIRDYPTLRMFYERYLNSMDNCGFLTNAFNYNDMDNFISLIGNYWVDLVEQVIPSTTIWGSTYKYSNTIFDNNKFKYRKGSLFTCEESNISPTIGSQPQIEVIKAITYIDDTGKPITTIEACNGVYISQINDGSEFLGSVTILGDSTSNKSYKGDTLILNELMDNSNNIINE